MVTYSTNGEDLAKELPSWMPRDQSSGNFKLLDVIGLAFDDLDADIDAVDRALSVQEADTIDQLIELAKLVDLLPETGEGKEHYRARAFSEFQLVTSEGTVGDIIRGAADILDTSYESIGYTEDVGENGVAQLKVPNSKLSAINLTGADFATIMDRLAPAGYRIETTVKGTFTYITPTDYNDAGFTHDATKAYDGLDANGDPKGNGGTYAGLVS